jgi:DNA-binding NarL/FixJ family response regulator
MPSKRVLIVSSHSLFREGLKRLLADLGEVVIVDQVGSVQEAGDLARQGEVDVVIIDQAAGSDNQASRNEAISCLLAVPSVRVISLSLDTDDLWVYRQERVVKASVDDLVAALRD